MVAGQWALWTGLASTASSCIAAWSVADFDCAVGAASGAAGGVFRPLSRLGAKALGLIGVDDFARGIFGVFRAGVTTAGQRLRK